MTFLQFRFVPKRGITPPEASGKQHFAGPYYGANGPELPVKIFNFNKLASLDLRYFENHIMIFFAFLGEST